MRYVLFALILTLLGTPGVRVVPAFGQASDPAQAVFRLITVTSTGDGSFKRFNYGTAFFIGTDGTALTTSHLVYATMHDPDRYSLMAVVDKEFYSVTVVCASRLQYDPTTAGEVRFSRDVAEIKIIPSAFPFETWVQKFKTGEEMTLATSHRGTLPDFPVLPLTGHPFEGQHISVIGFGHISPIAEKWTARGQIDKTGRASDGTEIFSIVFTNPARPGNSGSPVLDDQDRVVGLWDWYSIDQFDRGAAVNISALTPPCR